MRRGYEWATVRVVPRVDRGECVNVGVLVYCQSLGYLGCRVDTALDRAVALDGGLDVEAVRRHLGWLESLCAGDAVAGDNALRGPGERFRWLVAPRSTVVQTSVVHTGLTVDPAAELEALYTRMVA